MNKRRKKKCLKKYYYTRVNLKSTEKSFIENLRFRAVEYKLNTVEEAYKIYRNKK